MTASHPATAPAAFRPRWQPPTRRTWLDIAVLTVLALLGLLGFAVSFSSGFYLVAGVGGLIVGSLAGILAASLRLGPLLTGLFAAAMYFLLGSPLTMPAFALFGVLPSGASLSGLAVGAVFGWTDIITLTTPVVAPDYIAVLPYVATFVVGVISTTIAARLYAARRRTPLSSLLALLGPIALYAASVLLGTAQPYLAAVRGVAFAVIALVWLAWRVPQSDNASLNSTAGLLRGKLIGVAMIAMVAIIGGALLGAASAPTTAQRFVLRNNIQPPFDPLIYPSPLSGFRVYTKDTANATLFTVTGLTKTDRIRIATMDSYNGQVWNVTSPTDSSQASGTFGLVGAKLGSASLVKVASTETLNVAIGTYHDGWIPTSGYASSIRFTADAPTSTQVRYNTETGILIDTADVGAGQKYTLTIDQQATATDAQLEKVGVANISLPPVQNVPELIGSKATEFAGKATAPIDKLRAIEAAFKKQSILSHGTKNDAVPSRAGHGADRMKLLLSQTPMVGDQEQYASAFALMARSLGYPARVVMGFAPKTITPGQAVTVKSHDVTAWVEVAFQGVGWVPFDPTPDASNQPTVTPSKPKTESLPQVRQPPRTNNNQNDLVSPTEISKSKKAKPPYALPEWVVPTAFGVGIPLAIYFLPLLVIAAIKRRRRRRRRRGPNDRQAAGAWDELVDVYAELGYRAPRRATRVQSALLFEQQFRDELESRERERSAAAKRVSNRGARAEAKAAAKGQPASSGTTASSLVAGAMARLKDASTWRPGVAGENDAPPVLPGLREFAVAADAAVFSGEDVAPETVTQLWAELVPVEDAGRRSVSWLRRRLSAFRVRSRANLSRAFASRMAAVSSLNRKAATR
jgi:hypothetical protein